MDFVFPLDANLIRKIEKCKVQNPGHFQALTEQMKALCNSSRRRYHTGILSNTLKVEAEFDFIPLSNYFISPRSCKEKKTRRLRTHAFDFFS